MLDEGEVQPHQLVAYVAAFRLTCAVFAEAREQLCTPGSHLNQVAVPYARATEHACLLRVGGAARQRHGQLVAVHLGRHLTGQSGENGPGEAVPVRRPR